MEDEQKGKKKFIFKVGGVILLIIVVIIMFMIFSGGGNNKKELVDPICKLEVIEGIKNEAGEYTKEVKIGFLSTVPSSEDATIKEYGIGPKKVHNNELTYTLSKAGTTKIYGRIKDSNGKEGSCEIDVKIIKGISCTLEVIEGTLGENEWYTSNVKVRIANATASVNSATIVKYHLGLFAENSELPIENNDEYILKEDGSKEVRAYVEDSAGAKGECTIQIKKDATPPTCTLKVVSGTLSGKTYSTDVEVGFLKAEDNLAANVEYGLGVQKNYNRTNYVVKSNGTTKVYGYVKDEAGNENTCNTSISKGTSSGTNHNTQNLSCVLKATGTSGENGWFKGNVAINFVSRTPSTDGRVTKSGIGIKETYSDPSYTVSKDGTTTVYGYVEDSNGKKAVCSITVKKDAVMPSCVLEVQADNYNSSTQAYSGTVYVNMKTKTDSNSGVANYGIGLSKNYNNMKYKVISIGSSTITGYVKDKAGNESTCSITLKTEASGGTITTELLSKKVAIGDYVEYDAGNWTTTKVMPTSANPFAFGGYTSGSSRNASVTCYGSYANASSGWRVLKISGDIVILVHAGTPECYHHPYISGKSNMAYNSERILTGSTSGTVNSAYTSTPRDWSEYVNSTYANSATLFNKTMADGAPSNLVTTGSYYYLGAAYNTGSIYGVSSTGNKTGYSMFTYGVRPTVTLKATVKTAGKNASGQWKLSL